MIARVLEPEEWPLVEELEISQLLPLVRPEDVKVVVVEVGGEVVASMTVMRMTHIEGTWVDPNYRNGGIVRSLLRCAAKAAEEWCAGWVVTSANNDQVRRILERMNAQKVEVDSYALSFGREN